MHEEAISGAYGLWQAVPAHEESFGWYDMQRDIAAIHAEVAVIAHTAARQISWMLSYISSAYGNQATDLGGGYCAIMTCD